MAANDSTTGGYIRPSNAPPDYDDPLEDLFQGVVVGITGIPGNLVRPRWQPDPPNIPASDTNWVALGVAVTGRQWNSYQAFHPEIAPNGAYIQEGQEILEVSLSFYGPGHSRVRRELEDGLLIEQNRDALEAKGIKFVECRLPVQVPALLKQQWHMRSDVKVVFRRTVHRTLPIATIDSATGSLDNERYVTPISVIPSP